MPFLMLFSILVVQSLKMCVHVELLSDTIETFWSWRDNRDPLDVMRTHAKRPRSLL